MAKVLKVLKVLNFSSTGGRRFFVDIAARAIMWTSQVASPSRWAPSMQTQRQIGTISGKLATVKGQTWIT
jgi:hypothetical protein